MNDVSQFSRIRLPIACNSIVATLEPHFVPGIKLPQRVRSGHRSDRFLSGNRPSLPSHFRHHAQPWVAQMISTASPAEQVSSVAEKSRDATGRSSISVIRSSGKKGQGRLDGNNPQKKSPATKTGRNLATGPRQIPNHALRRRLTFVPAFRPNPNSFASLLRNSAYFGATRG